MAGTASLLSSLSNERETEQLVLQVISLWEQGLHGSTLILGDLVLANQQRLGLSEHPEWHLAVLLAYADALFDDHQHKRALHYYKESTKVLPQAQQYSTGKIPSELDVKWKMYRCHAILRQHQEALDTLSSIPLRLRNVQVAVALGNLYRNFKSDSRCALICYRQALSMCPYAIEAMLGLLSQGMSVSEIQTIVSGSRSSSLNLPHPLPPITSSQWVLGWLRLQEVIARRDYNVAITGFENLTRAGVCLGPQSNSQLAWCLTKVDKTTAAKELFSTAQNQDPYTLSHMDTYARILTDIKKLEKLSSSLVAASDSHVESWIAKAWHQTRNTSLSLKERIRASVLLENAYSYSSKSAEAAYCHAAIFWTKQDIHLAVQKYQEAVHLDPSFSEAYEALVRCYLLMRRDKEALSLARTAAQHIKRPAFLYYLQGVAMSQKPADTDKCRLLLEKAVKMDPSFQLAVIQLSKLYLRERAVENAVEVLRKYSEVHSSPLVHAELGNCLTLLRRYQEAMEHYTQALIQDPTYEKALRGMELLQQQLQSGGRGGGGGGGGGGEEGERIEGENLQLVVRPLDLENPLEMDSDEDIPFSGEPPPHHDYQW